MAVFTIVLDDLSRVQHPRCMGEDCFFPTCFEVEWKEVSLLTLGKLVQLELVLYLFHR